MGNISNDFWLVVTKKVFCKRDIVEKFTGGNQVERLAPTLTGYQSTTLSNHLTSID